jgi:uncharacterized protein (DUF1778 family)
MSTLRKRKATSSTRGVRMSLSLQRELKRAARRAGQSRNSFVVEAVLVAISRQRLAEAAAQQVTTRGLNLQVAA